MDFYVYVHVLKDVSGVISSLAGQIRWSCVLPQCCFMFVCRLKFNYPQPTFFCKGKVLSLMQHSDATCEVFGCSNCFVCTHWA